MQTIVGWPHRMDDVLGLQAVAVRYLGLSNLNAADGLPFAFQLLAGFIREILANPPPFGFWARRIDEALQRQIGDVAAYDRDRGGGVADEGLGAFA